VIEGSRACRVPREVRRAILRDLVARKTAPIGVLRHAVDAIAACPEQVGNGTTTAPTSTDQS
jgi:hypothetical protein